MATSVTNQKKQARCNTCTIQLVELCYKRKLWFRLFREPLILGMRTMCWWHRIDPREYEVCHERCYGCIRFMKVALKEKSSAFVRLNNLINPVFNSLRDSIITPEEKEEAKQFARDAMGPEEQ